MPYRFSRHNTDTSSANVILQLTTGANSGVSIIAFGWAYVDQSSTQQRCTLQRTSTAGTGTSRTPEKSNTRSPSAVSTLLDAFSADPTTSGNALAIITSPANATVLSSVIPRMWWNTDPRNSVKVDPSTNRIALKVPTDTATVGESNLSWGEDAVLPIRPIRGRRCRVPGVWQHADHCVAKFVNSASALTASATFQSPQFRIVQAQDWPDTVFQWNINLFGITGNLYTQDLPASMSTFDGALFRQTNKTLSGSMSTFAGTLSRSTLKSLVASMASFSGLVNKKTFPTHFLDASMPTFDATLTKQTNKPLTSSMSTFDAVLTEISVLSQAFSASMSTFAATLSELFIPGTSGGFVSWVSSHIRRSTKKQ